jgi:hypothetical protein
MPLLTREAILEADDRQFRDVEVPEWGGTVRVATMTGRARDRYEAGLYQDQGKETTYDNLRARFLSHCVVNEAGDLIFSVGDLEALGQKSSAALDRVFKVASDLNGTSADGVEDIAKN